MVKRNVESSGPARACLFAGAFVVTLLGLGGCQTTGFEDVTGSLGQTSEAPGRETPRSELAALRERHRANPNDTETALRYGKALRDAGQRAQAVAVLEQATLADPGNKALLAGYGRALADNGNFQQAFDVLSRAHTPEDPDWRILSVQGAVLDQLGRHEEAQQYYASALKIVPEEPSLLSNLGLSYVLENNLPRAEEMLRRAHAGAANDSRVRANLGLVIALQGRESEAESVVKADLPANEAAAKVAALRQMVSKRQARAEQPKPKPPATRLAKGAE